MKEEIEKIIKQEHNKCNHGILCEGCSKILAQALSDLMDRKIKESKERKLLEWCIEQSFEGHDIDGGDFEDVAERLGVLIKVKISQKEIDANPEKYAACLEYDTNELYYPYWSKELNQNNEKG